MVEFCQACKTSLPKADVTVRGGEIFASHDYQCPFCNELANPPSTPAPAKPAEPTAEMDVVIKAGKVAEARPEGAGGG